MLHITDEKDVKKFISYLNKVNQVFKNSVTGKDNPQSGDYTLNKSTIYSFNEELIANIKAKLVFTKKEDDLEEYFSNLSLYIKGKDLFKFFADNKKYINEIEELDDGLHLKTSIPELEYLIPKLNIKESNDIVRYKDFKTRIYDKFIKNKNYKVEYIMDTDDVKELINSDVPKIINCEGYRLRLTKKTLMGLKDGSKFTSSLIFRFYETDIEDVYIVDAIIDNTGYSTKFCSENFFSIINY